MSTQPGHPSVDRHSEYHLLCEAQIILKQLQDECVSKLPLDIHLIQRLFLTNCKILSVGYLTQLLFFDLILITVSAGIPHILCWDLISMFVLSNIHYLLGFTQYLCNCNALLSICTRFYTVRFYTICISFFINIY